MNINQRKTLQKILTLLSLEDLKALQDDLNALIFAEEIKAYLDVHTQDFLKNAAEALKDENNWRDNRCRLYHDGTTTPLPHPEKFLRSLGGPDRDPIPARIPYVIAAAHPALQQGLQVINSINGLTAQCVKEPDYSSNQKDNPLKGNSYILVTKEPTANGSH